MKKRIASCALVTLLAAVLSFPADTSAQSRKVIVFHAGSLSVPLAEMEKNFEADHPDVDVQFQGGGSTKMAGLISEKGEAADIMASADYTVIDGMLIPGYADWNIRFASNQLVLCYTEKSKYADTVNADNWFDILNSKDISWGHSDPDLDPCGYRSLMVMQLAEKYYKKPGLYDQLIAGRPKENVLPKAVELVSKLKSGEMDYGWEYLSVAVQHGLKYVKLPEEINLGNYKHDDFYKQAEVKTAGKKPGTWKIRTGQSCTYGITLIKTAPNIDDAVLFLDYLLNPHGGLKILDDMGQPPFIPARVPSKEMYDNLPDPLKNRVEVAD